MRYMIALAFALAMPTPASASRPYDELNDRLQAISKMHAAAAKQLRGAAAIENECRLGIKTGAACEKAEDICKILIEAFKETDEALERIGQDIRKSKDITDFERGFLATGYTMLDAISLLDRGSITKWKCPQMLTALPAAIAAGIHFRRRSSTSGFSNESA